MHRATSAVRALLLVTFTITGFSALTLQVVWQRMIALHGGVDLYSTTTVVAAFLAGLGFGNLAGGRLADRVGARGSVRAFAAANVAIAAFSAVSPWLFYDLYRRIEPAVDGIVASFLFHVVLLIVPTGLMGLSLPLLSRGVVDSDAEIAPIVGRLYSANTLGAAFGAAVSGWWLLGTFGFVTTVRLAAVCNLTAAVLAAFSSRLVDAPRTSATAAPITQQAPAQRGSVGAPARWIVLYGLTGAVALGLEIVFFRLIDAVMRSNSYTFAHVLSIYLLLFAIGSAIGSRIVRRVARPEAWFLWLQCAAGIGAVVGSLLLLAPLKLPDVGGVRTFLEDYFRTDGLATGFALPQSQVMFATVITPLIVMAAPVLCFGAAFPFIQAVVARRLDIVGRSTGTLLFANVVGNVAGTLVTGFVLLDWLGTSGTLRLLGALLVVPGLAAVAYARRWRVPLALGVVVAVAVPSAAFPSNRGLWALLHSSPNEGLIVEEERSCANALVPRGDVQLLTVNGASQNAYPYDEFHLLIGLLPALVHPSPSDALIVGLGVGGTSFGTALDPRLDSIETVEICGGQVDVIEQLASSGRSPESRALLQDARVGITVGDGRKRLLQLGENSLDLVVVDTLRPQSGYSGNLYSREFYELARSRLRPDGLFAQWLPTSRTRDTMQEVFPHLQLWTMTTYGGSTFALASSSPIRHDARELRERMAAVAEPSFDPAQAASVDHFLASAVPEVIRGGRPTAAGRRNEDLAPRDEYFLNNGY